MIHVTIPATSANIGSGFDTLGLALTLYNEVSMEESDAIDIRSDDGTPVPTTENNLIYSTAKHFYEVCGKELKGLKIRQINNIPMTRGLGSSSACIVGGLLGANALLGCPMGTDDLVNLAAQLEGHPDNSTPAILGGLVTAVLESGKVYHVKQEVRGGLRFCAIIPNFELSTELARKALPKEISHKDAVFNLSRAALLSASLLSGRYKNLRTAVEDKLHQPYRLKYIHGAEDVFEAAYKYGAYGCYISGAGSTLMAIVDSENTLFFDCLKKELGDMGLGAWEIMDLAIDNNGARFENIV